MSALSIRGLVVSFDGVTVVDGVDMEVAPGEFVGLVGPNGAGKSTLLRVVAGIAPHSGSVQIGGRPAHRMTRSERARAVALVPQRPVIPPGIRVFDYVLLGRTPHIELLASESAADIAATRSSIESLDVDRFADRQLESLSGGEAQRVVLARALAQGSPLMLLDEPTNALDVGHAQRVLELVDDLRASCGVTVLAAIHDLTLAAQFCDRLVMMAEGGVVASGRPADVLTVATVGTHYGATVRILEQEDGRVAVVPARSAASATSGSLHSAAPAEAVPSTLEKGPRHE